MFFELDGQTYRIKFFRMGNSTIAELYMVDLQDKTAEGDEEGKNPLVSLGMFGVALLHHNDQFVKKVGRKVALSHLLESLSDPEVSSPVPTLTKADREMIWAKYFESHKK